MGRESLELLFLPCCILCDLFYEGITWHGLILALFVSLCKRMHSLIGWFEFRHKRIKWMPIDITSGVDVFRVTPRRRWTEERRGRDEGYGGAEGEDGKGSRQDKGVLQGNLWLVRCKEQGLLKEWADDLASRPLDVKKSVEGRAATKACQQTADTLKGFFKLCTKRVRACPWTLHSVESSLWYPKQPVESGWSDGEGGVWSGRFAFVSSATRHSRRTFWLRSATLPGLWESRRRAFMNARVESVFSRRTADVWYGNGFWAADVMHNDTVRQYLTSIKRLMTYKEEKMKSRHASEFLVC